MRRGQEGRAPGRQCCIGCAAVSDPQGHGVTGLTWVSGRPEGGPGLVGGRASSAHQQKPGPSELEHDARSAVLPVQFRAQDIYPEITRGGRVSDHEDVRDRDIGAERTGLLAHPALPSSCLTRDDGAPQGPDVIIVVRGPAGSSARAPRRSRPTPTAASVLVSSLSKAGSSKPAPVNPARIGRGRVAPAPAGAMTAAVTEPGYRLIRLCYEAPRRC